MGSKAYVITGRPEIDPFENIIGDNPGLQNSFKRQFHQLPTHGYDTFRKKFNDMNYLLYENPNNIYKPIRNLESLKRRQDRRVKTLFQDVKLPNGISKQLPIQIDPSVNTKVPNSISKKYKTINSGTTFPFSR